MWGTPDGTELPDSVRRLRELVERSSTPAALRRALGALEREEEALRRRQGWAAIAELRALRRRIRMKLAAVDRSDD